MQFTRCYKYCQSYVTPIRLQLEYFAPCTIKQQPKNNRLAQMLQHMNWRIAAGSQCVVSLVGRGQRAQPILYIVTEHYHPNTQCRIGLISEVIVIGIYTDQHLQSYALVSVTFFRLIFSPKRLEEKINNE